MRSRTHFMRVCSDRVPIFRGAIQWRPISTPWSTFSCAGSKPPRIQSRGPDMPQQVELEPPQTRVSVGAGSSNAANAPMPDRRKLSARRLFAKVILASLFAIVVLVGLIYLVNSEAFQSTDDAFIDGHIIMVSS